MDNIFCSDVQAFSGILSTITKRSNLFLKLKDRDKVIRCLIGYGTIAVCAEDLGTDGRTLPATSFENVVKKSGVPLAPGVVSLCKTLNWRPYSSVKDRLSLNFRNTVEAIADATHEAPSDQTSLVSNYELVSRVPTLTWRVGRCLDIYNGFCELQRSYKDVGVYLYMSYTQASCISPEFCEEYTERKIGSDLKLLWDDLSVVREFGDIPGYVLVKNGLIPEEFTPAKSPFSGKTAFYSYKSLKILGMPTYPPFEEIIKQRFLAG